MLTGTLPVCSVGRLEESRYMTLTSSLPFPIPSSDSSGASENRGAFSKVYECKRKKDGLMCAAKVVKFADRKNQAKGRLPTTLSISSARASVVVAWPFF